MKFNNYIIFFALVLFTPLQVFSSTLVIGDRIEINSKILNEQRELQVLLPENYQSDAATTYPVLYLLDGDYNFHSVSGLLDLLANKAQLIPDVILVGIADKGTDKYRQYMTPKGFTAPLKKQDEGKASEFLAFINQELKPYINSNYKTSGHDILFGHSIAGLFVLNTLLESPDSFTTYLASSPSLWLNNQAFLKKAKKILPKSQHKPVSLYLSLGDETRMNQYALIDLLDDLQPKNINWQFKHYPDENHNSVGIISLRNSLKHIFKDWFIAEKKLNKLHNPHQLVTEYKTLLDTLQLKQPIPTPSIKAMIRYFYRSKQQAELPAFMAEVKKVLPSSEAAFIMMQASYIGHFESQDKALTLLLESEEQFFNSIEYIKQIAVTYEKLKSKKMALSYYKKALLLSKDHQSNLWQTNIIEAKLIQNKL